MIGIGDTLPEFEIVGVKPGFNHHEENGESAFETLTENSFEGKWKVIFFYPKDFTFVCPTEIAEFARLAGDFEDRDCVICHERMKEGQNDVQADFGQTIKPFRDVKTSFK